MNYLNKKIIYIDLEARSFDIKSYPELYPYVGGLPMGLKIADMHLEEKPLIFCVGPLNGFFPYVSKTCVINTFGSLETFYLGGSLSSRIRFSSFDALVVVGESAAPVFIEISREGAVFFDNPTDFMNAALPGRSARLFMDLSSGDVLLDSYFRSGNSLLEEAFIKRNIAGLIVNGTSSVEVPSLSHYEKLYSELLQKGKVLHNFLHVGEFPSCVGCPLGCEKSQVGETSGNFLVHSLVACDYLKDLYSDLGIVFSCLDVLGYNYLHEDLEAVPKLTQDLLSLLEKKI